MKSKLTSTVSNEHRAARKANIATWNAEGMDILIRVEGVELNDKLREALNRKIGRVRQYAPRALRARVQLHKLQANPSPRQYCAKVLYEIPGNDLFAEHTAHDPVAAINIVAEKIEGRLRRRKTARLARRVRDAHIQPDRSAAMAKGVICKLRFFKLNPTQEVPCINK